MNKADELFEMLQAAYLRGAIWVMENGSSDGLNKAAYDYADYQTSPLTIAERAALSASPAGVGVETRTFNMGDMVRKRSGSWWEGRVVGFYSTEQTPDGVCVQLDKPMGPVQIYPAAALTKEATHD